jgi:hypothetical protein
VVLGVVISTVSVIVGGTPDHRHASDSAYGIPISLQPSLDHRLAMFIAAQSDQRWDDVALLLGRYRKGGNGFLYTPEHKGCLLSQIQSAPMISFVVETTGASSELRDTPPERWWWYLRGSAVFKRSSGVVTTPTTVVAYLDQGDWYFTPPNYDTEWEEAHVTAADRGADYRSEVQVDLDPGCPLEVRDLHVRMDEKYLSLRNMTFALANKTQKKITGYGLGLARDDEECFGITSGRPAAMNPGAVSVHEKPLSYSAYLYYCDGVSPRRLVFDYVQFADGSTWNDPRVLSNEYKNACERQ